jgi:hypothetical protein
MKRNQDWWAPGIASWIDSRASGQVLERKWGVRLYWNKLMTVSLSGAFIVSSE